MNKKEGYKEELRELIGCALRTGEDKRLREHLASNSNLPGPRGNLELAYAFAEVTSELSMDRPEELWALAYELTLLPPDDAPVNDPLEIVPFCGAISIGAIGSEHEGLTDRTLARLKEMSSDPRWRTREGVAMGLQHLIAKRGTACLNELETWISDGGWLAMRAVAAGVAEPSLLRDRHVAVIALDLHRKIIDRIVRSDDRKGDDLRTLRQAMGYSLSVVVSALPEDGFDYMRSLAGSSDKDVRWILKENLKKKRLLGSHPSEVKALADMLR